MSELGTYGYLIGNGQSLQVYENHSSGHILRSKAEHVNEGGVAVGAAVIDTPFLVWCYKKWKDMINYLVLKILVNQKYYSFINKA